MKFVCALSSPVDLAHISEPSLFPLGYLGLVVRDGRRIYIAFGIFLQLELRIMMHSLSHISCYGHVCNGWFSFSFLDIPMSIPFFCALLTTRCEKKYLETRDLGASLAIEFTNVLARARRWASAATK